MIAVAVMAVGITALAAWATLRVLKKEYLPLLIELTRAKKAMEQADEPEKREGEEPQ